jgi:hypothetical protein
MHGCTTSNNSHKHGQITTCYSVASVCKDAGKELQGHDFAAGLWLVEGWGYKTGNRVIG